MSKFKIIDLHFFDLLLEKDGFFRQCGRHGTDYTYGWRQPIFAGQEASYGKIHFQVKHKEKIVPTKWFVFQPADLPTYLEIKPLRNGGVFIQKIYVLPKHRRKGLAKAALKKLQEIVDLNPWFYLCLAPNEFEFADGTFPPEDFTVKTFEDGIVDNTQGKFEHPEINLESLKRLYESLGFIDTKNGPMNAHYDFNYQRIVMSGGYSKYSRSIERPFYLYGITIEDYAKDCGVEKIIKLPKK